MQILTNQIGYLSADYKMALLQGADCLEVRAFQIIDRNGEVVYEGEAKSCGPVSGWNTGSYWSMDFTDVTSPGRYTIRIEISGEEVCSYPFSITEFFQDMRMLNAVSYYFKAQRNSGEWQEADRRLSYQGGMDGTRDVHGGWIDATGDDGIHMSHLSYSSICNPQQAGFSAYVFFQAAEKLLQTKNCQYSMLIRRMLDEGSYGADFIMRMNVPDGSFLISKGREDEWGAAEYTRSIERESFAQKENRPVSDRDYQVSFRSGGGTCIAALAAAARHSYPGTDYSAADYLQTAKRVFWHLWKKNDSYCNDGTWNLLDEYCALEAAAELHRTTGEYDYLRKAEDLAERMLARMVDTENGGAWFMARPGELFCHAADEGLPVVALLNFTEIECPGTLRDKVLTAVERAMKHLLTVTDKVSNPFGYARYCHSTPEGGTKDCFFYYHTSPAAPWWQGDNARIASLAAAAWLAASYVEHDLAEQLCRFAQNQINWIMGLNPFDACMIEGYGRNNIQYFFRSRYDFINCPGGICNGITSGINEEDGILFVQEPTAEIDDNWRWAEQWLPHGTWYIYAMTAKQLRGRRQNGGTKTVEGSR